MKLELNLETLRCLAKDATSGSDEGRGMTHFCTVTCNHTTCEVC